MKLQDYLPFYIGCKCVTPDGIGTITGLPWRILQQDRVTVHFGKQMIKTVNSIDGGYNKVRNHGDYALFAKRYEPIGSEGVTEDGFDMPGGVKPILRRLEDITDEEKIELFDIYNSDVVVADSWKVNSITKWVNNKTPESDLWTFEQTHYLLKKGFDIFSLIEHSLAIDSKTLK